MIKKKTKNKRTKNIVQSLIFFFFSLFPIVQIVLSFLLAVEAGLAPPCPLPFQLNEEKETEPSTPLPSSRKSI